MSNSQPATPVMWEVVSSTPAQGQGPSGAYGPGHLVTARLVGSNSTFQVFVPNADFTVDGVRAMVDAKAQTVAAVNNLKSHPQG